MHVMTRRRPSVQNHGGVAGLNENRHLAGQREIGGARYSILSSSRAGERRYILSAIVAVSSSVKS